jgi:general secretion pathway protein F
VADLPFFSQVLISWGQLVEGHALLAGGVLVGIPLIAIFFLRQKNIRARLGDALWRVPAIGERLKVYQLARLYRTTGMLLRGGMPLVSALGMSAELLHPVLRASRAISEGRNVSESLEANGLATPVAMRMLVVGESSGNMGEMMDRAASFHDEELARWVDWFTRLFEPLLMAVIGLVIGAIVVLMYMPIFELAGNLR